MLSVAFLKNTHDLPSKMENVALALGMIESALDAPHISEALWAKADDLYQDATTFALRLEMDCMWAEGHWEALAEVLGWVRDFLKEVDSLTMSSAFAYRSDLRSALESITTN